METDKSPVTDTTENQAPIALLAPPKQTLWGQISTLLFNNKRRSVLIGVLAVVLVGGTVYTILNKPADQDAVTSDTSQRSLMGAETLLVDGSAEYSTKGTEWTTLKSVQKLEEGDKVRTSENGRVVINLDDGSAIRINNSSAITLASLDSTNVQITNDSGEVYTRVVASDRSFVVKIGKESYEALGTAYKTVNRDTTKGVEVYHSKVAVKTAGQTVEEGKRYYQSNPTSEIDRKVSDIPLDQLQKDSFLQWNLEKDKTSTEFKDKLGYLSTLEKTPAPAPAPVEAKPAAAGIKLSGTTSEKGVTLSWSVSGLKVSKGFKIVKSTSANPTFGKDDAAFVEATATSYKWTIKDGKTYHFRICLYDGSSCTNYSNDVTVKAPLVAPPSPPTGSLTLSPVSGTTVGWTLSGSAPYGLKLVWSNTSGPVYPGSSAKYYDGVSTSSATFTGDAGNTYYLRVCMYYEDTCMNYSNEITVTLP